MRNLMISLLLCTAGITAYADSAVVVHYKDGTTAGVYLKDTPVVTVEGANMVISSDAPRLEAGIADIDNFTVGEYDGIEDARTENIRIFWSDNNHADVQGAKTVALYTINGICLTECQGDTSLDFSNLAPAIYIIKADNKTFKILRK